MINLENKENCCGCTACASICPQKCIDMVSDEEGFLYPVVDVGKCMNCSLCEKVCPIKNKAAKRGNPGSVVTRNRDDDVVKDSTSGGAFSSIASELILQKGAIVYGAGFSDTFEVKHMSCETVDGLKMFRGSKFVQSNLEGIFCEVRDYLKVGRTVLFSGTPCQVEGLKCFLGGKYEDNLFCVDIVCRGVPSPKLWDKYLYWIQKKYNSSICKVKFRNKTYGYHSSTMLVEFVNGKVYKKSGRIDPMMRLFTKEMCSRPSCSKCQFKTKQRISDLTLFDCKRYEGITGKKDDDKGYTAILIQSSKGEELLNQLEETLSVETVDTDKLIEQCGIMLCGSATPNNSRAEFFERLDTCELEELTNDLCNISIKDFFIENTKNFLFRTKLIKLARRIKKHEKINVN